MIKEYKIKSLSKILLISTIVILLLGGTLIYYYSITVTKSTKTITVTETITATETKTVTTIIFLDTDGDGIPNYKEKEYGTDPNKPNFLLAYALKKLPENEALKFKNVENFNESSKVLVDYFSSLPENIRNSKKVNDLLNQILSDNIINELEKNLFYDKFVLPSLPLIFNLEWIPTREKLDKIYDINITFIAKDDNTLIAYAELRFIPVEYYYMIEKYGMRQEDYSKVFPPDKERVYVLTPIDGKFDGLEEKFSVSITDIIGGREYKIVVLIRDLAGNERKAEIKTPYIRQFENLGRELYERGMIVAATYYPLYPNPHPWEWLKPMFVHPIYGDYHVTDPIIVAKTIDIFSGYGGNTLFLDYGIFQPDQPNEVILQNIEDILKVDITKQIYFSIMYELPARARRAGLIINDQFIYNDNTDLGKLQIILEDFKKLSTLFNKDNFLKLRGKPVIYIYEGQGVRGDVSKFFERIKNTIEKETSTKPYIIVDYATPLSTPPWQPYPTDPKRLERALNVDGWTAWWAGYYLDRPEREYFNNFEDYVENGYKIWNKLAREYSRDFITSILPGWINLRHPESHVPLPRDVKRFEKLVEIALSYSISPNENFKKFIRIDTYNEWGESTGIEPTIEEGTLYLETLKNTLLKYLIEPKQ